MKESAIINTLMFDYENLSEVEIIEYCKMLPRKKVRWLGINHPDNRTRKIFFALTGISIGEGTVINSNFVVSDGYKNLLRIGERVAIAPNVTVICESEPNNSLLSQVGYVKEKLICSKPVVIEDDVWIGTNVVILPGVIIGNKSIIGAGSVVAKSIPPFSVVAGNPAKVLRTLKNDNQLL